MYDSKARGLGNRAVAKSAPAMLSESELLDVETRYRYIMPRAHTVTPPLMELTILRLAHPAVRNT